MKEVIQEVSKIYNEEYDKLTIDDKVFIVNSIVKHEVLIWKNNSYASYIMFYKKWP